MQGAVEREEEQVAEVAAGVDFAGEPDFVVDAAGGELEGGAFGDVGDEACADLEAVDEVAFEVLDGAVLLVDGEEAGELFEGAFAGVVGFGFGVAGVVDEDGVAAGYLDAAGV